MTVPSSSRFMPAAGGGVGAVVSPVAASEWVTGAAESGADGITAWGVIAGDGTAGDPSARANAWAIASSAAPGPAAWRVLGATLPAASWRRVKATLSANRLL